MTLHVKSGGKDQEPQEKMFGGKHRKREKFKTKRFPSWKGETRSNTG